MSKLWEIIALPLLVLLVLTRNTMKAIAYWRSHEEVG